MRELCRRLALRPCITAEVVAATFFVALLNLASPLFVMQILRRYISTGVDGTLYLLSLGMCGAMALFFCMRWARTRLAVDLCVGPDEELADRVFHALARIKAPLAESLERSRIVSILDKLQSVQAAYDAGSITSVLDVPFATIYLGAAWHISPAMAFIGLGGMVVMFVFALATHLRADAATESLRDMSAEQQGHTQSALFGVDTVRAFQAENFLRRTWDMQARRINAVRFSLAENRGLNQSVIRVVLILVSTAVYVQGAMEVVRGDMNVGSLIGASILTARAVQVMASYAQATMQFGKAARARQEIEAFMAMPCEREDGQRPEAFAGHVALEACAVAYASSGVPVFKDFSLDIAPGTLVVASGFNGSGKTTLARLLAGLIEPTGGRVLIDGQDMATLSLAWWRRQLMYLPQEPTFFNASFRDNIRIANPALDDVSLRAIVQTVNLSEFFMKLPRHMETMVVDAGRSLPMGIKRRLALARALAANGSLVIMDEPSEGLDAEGCAMLYALLGRMAAVGKTMVLFSHDPTIIRMAHVLVDLSVKPTPSVTAAPQETRVVPAAAPGGGDIPDAASLLDGVPAPAPGPSWSGRLAQTLFALCGLFCVAFTCFAAIHEQNISAKVAGRVVPLTQVKRVQHLEGGIVQEIKVREGDLVRAGQPLLVLERVQSGSRASEMEVHLVALQADIARLRAEAEDRDTPDFPPGFAAAHPEIAASTTAHQQARRALLDSQLAIERHRVEQARQTIRMHEFKVVKTQERLAIMEKELAICESLVADELISEMNILALRREANDLRGSLANDRARLERARAGLVGVEEELHRILPLFHEEVAENLRKTQREYGEFVQRGKVYDDAVARAVLRAPVDGTVKSVQVDTPGEVVAPGATIMTIVPTDDTLVILAHMPIDDIGFVQLGQVADVHLPIHDRSRFGTLAATVVEISPDAFAGQDGRPYYVLRLETRKTLFERDGHRYRLYPGMLLEAYVHTGRRTLLEYLLSPYFIDA
ncbi:MAG: HlyD family type I secretion periplasmic adaptor subunit [Desulfovibrionaceae bacterium]